MKKNLNEIVSIVSCAVLLAGCAQQQQQQGGYTPHAAPAPAKAAPVAAPAPVTETAGKVSAYFPSGRADGSGLLVEKSAPAQALAGQPFDYTYKVSNLTDATLENVMVVDRVSGNFTASDSDPKASVKDGLGTWSLGSLGPKESKVIAVRGSSADEGTVSTCGWATYNPVACQDIRIVKANIQLTKNEPPDVLICDPIPATLMVKNTGSSALSGVQITDSLPSGLTSDGKGNLTFDVGTLAPGESREVKYNAAASSPGKFVNTAKVTTTEGVSAEASATTTVHQPVLTMSCKADEQQYIGRKFNVCYTISNTGDAPAAGAVLEVGIPSGLSCVSTTGSGQVSGGKVVWNLDSVGVNAPQNVCATFSSESAGTFDFAGTVKGSCAAPVSTRCQSRVVGIAAILLEKADDPDPVAIGDTTTYTVKVTNQGSADDHNVHIVVIIAPELVPVSSSEGTISGQTVTMPAVATLAPKQVVTYKIVAKGVSAGDGHTLFKLNSEVLTSPITAEESTTVY